uniref:AlNc14C130G6923 protein n=1 Tax=Albugo laibachii Nc14 TaxID=890382 RepID=F0WK71_9STRA|nr:AlNc14C130G6923 [Albugo laibachii Nc14]|eukprot:CCA21674.1 AlNc14C130G6923 [Albugo laibachii Nc14]
MAVKDCYRNYERNLDTEPIGAHISLYAPNKAVILDGYNECVLAYHLLWEVCDSCLKTVFNNAANFSAITSLFSVKPIEKMKLRNCITTSDKNACSKLVFIHNEVCRFHSSDVSEPEAIRSEKVEEVSSTIIIRIIGLTRMGMVQQPCQISLEGQRLSQEFFLSRCLTLSREFSRYYALRVNPEELPSY